VLSGRLISTLWICFVVYWIVSARGVKRSVGRESSASSTLLRVAVTVGVVALARHGPAGLPALHEPPAVARGLDVAGVALCACGIGVAIWARTSLGRNWGTPASIKEAPELVTSGPYRLIRHPIYSGLLLAMAGTVLVDGRAWVVLLALLAVYFGLSARLEERTMAREFPDAYAGYRARTKMLVPYLGP